jgi:hypothetical protein
MSENDTSSDDIEQIVEARRMAMKTIEEWEYLNEEEKEGTLHEIVSQLADAESALKPNSDSVEGTVWVVVSRGDGSPHPYVEAVYENESAAQAHKSELAENSFQHGVVAWGVFEQDIELEVSDDE